ncbi:MAG: hypothetical protein ABSC08_10875 [Bryobacteraceae bacterium]|jgi:hypothetical protein
MKTTAMMTMAAMLGSMAWAASKPDDQKVVACFEEAGGSLREGPQARMIASALFQTAGVKLEWHTGLRFCEAQRDQVILVSLSMNTPKDLLPGALAYARPFEGVHIKVLYDRIATGAHSPQLRPYLLAYVIVHEITHILEGIDRHSDSGIMKAQWGEHERDLIMRTRLRFTEQDIEMIHQGLAVHAAHRASGTLVAAAPLQ